MENLVKTSTHSTVLGQRLTRTVTESFNTETGELYASIMEYTGMPGAVMEAVVIETRKKYTWWEVIATKAEEDRLTVTLQMKDGVRQD